MSATAIPIDGIPAAEAQGRMDALLAAVERSEVPPMDAFDALVATASRFRPVGSLGLETPAYAESRAKSQALERALGKVVDRALAALPAEPAKREAALRHMQAGLEPFASPAAGGEARWSGAGVNELLYRIVKAEEPRER